MTTMMTTYRYALLGEIPDAVAGEVRHVHDLGNHLVEIELGYEAAKAAAWEGDPVAGPALGAAAAAQDAADQARDRSAKAKQAAGHAAKTGNRARLDAAKAEARQAREELSAALAALRAARQALRDVKSERWPQAQRSIAAARQERDDAITATYPEFRARGMYWASWNDVVAHHRAAVRRVGAARREGRPAGLSFRRWDGTGTATVQIQREQGVTRAERDQVAAMREAGMSTAQIAEAAGRPAMTIARMKADGPEKPGDPPCTPAVLASGHGKWRGVLQAGPELPADYWQRPRGERRRLARQGRVGIRTGAGDSAAWSEMGAVIHRPMHPDAEITMARVTITRCGPDLSHHVTLPARVPAPQAVTSGRRVAVHCGWRAMPDGSLRVAVAAGAGPVPRHLAETGCVRGRGGWHEVTVPAAWRQDQARIEKMRSRRDAALNGVREEAARWLEDHPQPGSAGLPPPGRLRQWQAPGAFAALARRCRAGEHGDAAIPLGALLGAWAEQDLPAWREEARARRRLTRHRDDAWGQVAAWLLAGARQVLLDEWDMRDTARRPGPLEDDSAQEEAARANRVLAAPGELRARIASGATARGVEAAAAQVPEGGQVHAGCGGDLDPAERMRRVAVTCGRCGAVVDQDVNMLAMMLA